MKVPSTCESYRVHLVPVRGTEQKSMFQCDMELVLDEEQTVQFTCVGCEVTLL